jgi:hypothetical protein
LVVRRAAAGVAARTGGWPASAGHDVAADDGGPADGNVATADDRTRPDHDRTHPKFHDDDRGPAPAVFDHHLATDVHRTADDVDPAADVDPRLIAADGAVRVVPAGAIA